MPYIKPEERKKWKETIEKLVELAGDTDKDKLEGHLNFVFSSVLKKIYSPSYANFNKAVGLLECVKMEFYRKLVAPYEDKKIKENGDI